MCMEKKHISDFSDEDFVSFLFCERDRENNLSEFHGWNNWALIGAIASAICAGYAVLKKSSSLDTLSVIYNVNCLLAFFFTYHSWSRLFRRERGVDFSKVRMLKDVLPTVTIVFVFVCAIASVILIPIIDKCNTVFWLWITIITAYVIVVCVALFLKEKVVPSFFKEMILPWIWINAGFESIIGGFFSLIGTQSYKLAGSSILTPEFEFSACISAILVLLYILFKLNFSNKVVRKFDEIIDKYLYAGATKEDTFREISKNRMGYSVFDACYKELQQIERRTKLCVDEEQELDQIKDNALAKKYSCAQLKEKQDRIDVMIKDMQNTIYLSQTLVNRMNEIVKVSASFKDITEIQHIFDTNIKCLDKVKSVLEKVRDVSQLLNDAEKEILTELITALEKVIKETKSEK